MLVVPLAFLLICEIVLRLAGAGYPTGFLLSRNIGGTQDWVINERFGWRFLGPELARAPFPFAIPEVKPPNVIRVFVFGESAAYGDPQPEFGLSRMLQALLEGRYPDKKFEVVNTAMTAINSHVILPIARDCASHQGDFWVIYMGNNEVVGPFGAGTVFGTKAPSLSRARLEVAIKATRLGQLVDALVRNLRPKSLKEQEWGGMGMFLGEGVRADDPRMATVYHSFEQNLDAILDLGHRSGARVLVGTVCRNLKDCGPFASDHPPGLVAEALKRWNDLFEIGVRAQEEGRLAEATNSFAAALTSDGGFAECWFRLAQCTLALGGGTASARQFSTACDQDCLRFRADSRINDLIRRAASNRARNEVELVDCEAALARQSPGGILGHEFLYDHVHLTFEGNYLLARTFAESLATSLGDSAHPWPSAEACARRLGWNDFFRRAAEKDMLTRFTGAPFTGQADHREQYSRMLEQVRQLQPAGSRTALEEDKAQLTAAVKSHPEDWILWENLSQVQMETGDPAGAADSLRRWIDLLPFSFEAWQSLGSALEQAGQNDEALRAFEKANRLRPESVVGLSSLAEFCARSNRPDEAEQAFRAVLRRKPYWCPAHLGLAKILEQSGRKDAADAEFKKAFESPLRTRESCCALAKVAFAHGWYEAAATNLMQALQVDPGDAQAHVNLGQTLSKLGRGAEAKAHYQQAVALDPDLAEAHLCLGLQAGKEGDDSVAAAEFTQAVRLKPDWLEARINLGIALANQHQRREALEQFDEVLRRDPSNRIAAAYSKALRGQ